MFELPDEAVPYIPKPVLGAVVEPNADDDPNGLDVAPSWNKGAPPWNKEPEPKPELELNRPPRGSGLRAFVPPTTGCESFRLPKEFLVVPVLLFVVGPDIGDRVPNGPGAKKLAPALV